MTTTSAATALESAIDDVQRPATATAPTSKARAGTAIRGRIAAILLAALAILGIAGVAAPAASAWTYTSVGTATATSWGFQCSASGAWLRVNWPNISVRAAANQNVYVRGFLYQWNGRTWVHVRTSGWYVGVSNVSGRHILYYVGGLPHYFAIPGRPSLVADNTGFTFRSLARANYTVVEQYYAAGKYWNAQSHLAYAGHNNASPTSCVA